MITSSDKNIIRENSKEVSNIVTVIDADKLGRDFFVAPLEQDSASIFFGKLLTDTSFVSLYKALRYGYVKPEHAPKHYITNSLGLHDLDSGYFHLFLELADFVGLDSKTVMQVAVESFIGDSLLQPWQKAAKGYILRCAEADFSKTAKLLIEFDSLFTTFAILLEKDVARSAVILIEKLLYGVNINKAAIRRLLIANKIDIHYLFGDSYFTSDLKTREAIVRLALLYKTESECESFLEIVKNQDPSAHIRRLIISHSDRDIQKPQKAPQTPLEEFECYLTDGTTIAVGEFLSRLNSDEAFNKLASELFFSIYEKEVLVDIVVVEDGCVCDLDNCSVELKPSCRVGVLHPIEIPTKYSYLKSLNIAPQPFFQIKRPSYFATDFEKMSNEIRRVCGTVVNAELFRKHLKEHNFRLVFGLAKGLYEYAAFFLGEYSMVLEFTPTDFSNPEQTLTLKQAKIYRGSDFVPVRGNLYIEGARTVRIDGVPSRQLSECIYALLKVGNLTT